MGINGTLIDLLADSVSLRVDLVLALAVVVPLFSSFVVKVEFATFSPVNTRIM